VGRTLHRAQWPVSVPVVVLVVPELEFGVGSLIPMDSDLSASVFQVAHANTAPADAAAAGLLRYHPSHYVDTHGRVRPYAHNYVALMG